MKDTKEFYSKLMKDMSIHGYGFMGLKVFLMYDGSVPFDTIKAGTMASLVPKCLYEYGLAVTPW